MSDLQSKIAALPEWPMNEDDVLAVDPFAGDFGDPGDLRLRDRMVTARKAGPCCDCRQTIQPGERVRSMTSRIDGEMRTIRWCRLCCEAMALSWTDGFEAWTARLEIGRQTRASDKSSATEVPR